MLQETTTRRKPKSRKFYKARLVKIGQRALSEGNFLLVERVTRAIAQNRLRHE